ncbi:DUF4377 domain-containing protein [uncultured Aquimarina sp.]|uniref:DUF4377 domain-containing protein n=1 Tax=uncultured Aquimarina sp. TaxID=575652 RepID=UPI00260AB254|nr:DUF4377 domain-containing protein [uncultured Aquimarina sp.]
MKKLFSLLVLSVITISCNNDDEYTEITKIKVHHYMDTGFVSFFGDLGVINLIQEGDQIGEEEFQNSYQGIRGFEYELGFTHELMVSKTHISDPPQDGSSIRMDLLKVLSKTPASMETEFKIQMTLNSNIDTFFNWVEVDQENNFYLTNSNISINCGDLCSELLNHINNQEQITGVFTHGEEDSYILKEIINE